MVSLQRIIDSGRQLRCSNTMTPSTSHGSGVEPRRTAEDPPPGSHALLHTRGSNGNLRRSRSRRLCGVGFATVSRAVVYLARSTWQRIQGIAVVGPPKKAPTTTASRSSVASSCAGAAGFHARVLGRCDRRRGSTRTNVVQPCHHDAGNTHNCFNNRTHSTDASPCTNQRSPLVTATPHCRRCWQSQHARRAAATVAGRAEALPR